LVIKSTGAVDHYPDIKDAIRNAAAVDPRIVVIDQSLPRAEVLGLIRAGDAYVSLHRSEGSGLGMAEAMSFARIVIGTGFSGCTDFLNEQTGFPVPFVLRAVAPHEYSWSEGQFWAEPDMDAAIATMQRVYEARDLARERATAGQMLVLQKFSATVVGQAMKERIVRLIKA
jgi:glycosyltransferase involved in cell wall biosynthesis